MAWGDRNNMCLRGLTVPIDLYKLQRLHLTRQLHLENDTALAAGISYGHKQVSSVGWCHFQSRAWPSASKWNVRVSVSVKVNTGVGGSVRASASVSVIVNVGVSVKCQCQCQC